jgi:hypothetical protein
MSVYLENRRTGELEVFVPSRFGILRGTHQSNHSDKVLLAFLIHNNGSLFRDATRIRLSLSAGADEWEFLAIGRFDQLKDLHFPNRSLSENSNYSLLTSLALDRGQFVAPNLLFYLKDDAGWVQGGKRFRLQRGDYSAQLVVECIEPTDGNGYQRREFRSLPFKLSIKYEPSENQIDTFTDIGPLQAGYE